MKEDIIAIWHETLKLLEHEMTLVAFNTWLRTITPYSDGDKLLLSVPNEFNKEIIENRYNALITNALKEVTSKDIPFEIVLSIEGVEDHIKKSLKHDSTEIKEYENLTLGIAVGKILGEIEVLKKGIDEMSKSINRIEEQFDQVENFSKTGHE